MKKTHKTKQEVTIDFDKEYLRKRSIMLLGDANADNKSSFACADTPGFMNMLYNSIKNGVNCDSQQMKNSIEPCGAHVLFYSELVTENQLKTLWWVKTTTEEEPIAMGLVIDEYVFEVNTKVVITEFDSNGQIVTEWFG